MDRLCGSVASARAIVSLWPPYAALQPSARRLEFASHIPSLDVNIGKCSTATNVVEEPPTEIAHRSGRRR
jgi:hypothetical protein